MSQFLTTIFREDDAVEVCVDYDADYQAECVTRLPEDCYPAYGDMTINSVTLEDGADAKLSDKEMDDIIQAAWEDYHGT
jgi:hypothetical protein